MTDPATYLSAFEAALQERIKDIATMEGGDMEKAIEADQASLQRYCIGIEGSFGADRQLSPRTLASTHLGTLVCVEGIVTRCTRA